MKIMIRLGVVDHVGGEVQGPLQMWTLRSWLDPQVGSLVPPAPGSAVGVQLGEDARGWRWLR